MKKHTLCVEVHVIRGMKWIQNDMNTKPCYEERVCCCRCVGCNHHSLCTHV